MKEIPIPLVRANQLFLVTGTLLAILLQSQWVLLGVFIIILFPVLLGARANLIFMIARPLLREKLLNAEKEDIRLQRFNQRIACILIGVGTVILLVNGHWSGYLFAGMVTVAAGAALAGYCIGCALYFQWRQWRYKMSK